MELHRPLAAAKSAGPPLYTSMTYFQGRRQRTQFGCLRFSAMPRQLGSVRRRPRSNHHRPTPANVANSFPQAAIPRCTWLFHPYPETVSFLLFNLMEFSCAIHLARTSTVLLWWNCWLSSPSLAS
ncbi:hypothetical protein RB4692 [Rhodopirellula baltica SH 1]|uniref:Uncharacterized protein n=1 Tax=Rhodopirellula baltica (strain DSM 10527 / NCIMB 13988 / SH1) TaxID=243090 RepID=Q7US62_RHOBA|nr:hypothetical protein RB4692 [Rhodopirellula baltica SH 1]